MNNGQKRDILKKYFIENPDSFLYLKGLEWEPMVKEEIAKFKSDLFDAYDQINDLEKYIKTFHPTSDSAHIIELIPGLDPKEVQKATTRGDTSFESFSSLMTDMEEFIRTKCADTFSIYGKEYLSDHYVHHLFEFAKKNIDELGFQDKYEFHAEKIYSVIEQFDDAQIEDLYKAKEYILTR